jgi:outer membrane receptor protein involved in Fe transport
MPTAQVPSNIQVCGARDLSGTEPEVDGTSTFRRLNPAAGLTWTPDPGVNAFGAWIRVRYALAGRR